MRYIVPILSLFLFGAQAHAYEISVRLINNGDSMLYLGKYVNGKTYAVDTTTIDLDNVFVFKGSNTLDHGMYFIYGSNKVLFNLLIGKDQNFALETCAPDYVTKMSVKGDFDNEIFFADMVYNKQRNREAARFVTILKDTEAPIKEKILAKDSLEKITLRVEKRADSIIHHFPYSLLAILMKSKKQIEPPKQVSDSTAKYNYFLNHYWDNYDLGNPFLLNQATPIYKAKVDTYLDKVVHPSADSIISHIGTMASMASSHQANYRFLIWHLTQKYQYPKIMGQDRVFVYLYDTYYSSGEMDTWANGQLKNNLKERSNQLRYSLIGMDAPPIVALNEYETKVSLHALNNEYIIIYFYDPDCSHCKVETPRLKQVVENSPFDVGVLTISTDTSMIKMKEYIREFGLNEWSNVNGYKYYGTHYSKNYDALSTPTIYVLDRNKKILAKKIKAEQLGYFLENNSNSYK